MGPARRVTLIVVAVHVVVGVLFLSPAYIRPDSIATYEYLRSVAFDGDLAFFNEWASAGLVTRNGVTLFSEVSPNGALSNHWWIGTSLISSIPYAVVRGIGLVAPALAPRDGFGGLFGVVLAWITVALAAACGLMAWTFLRERMRLSARDASLALAATAIGTPLFWYTYRFPLGTHLAAAFSIALVVDALFRRERDEAADGLVAGLGAGLAIATRIQHAVLLPVILFAVIRQRRTATFWRNAIAAGALPIAAQAIAWQAVYGTPLGPLARGATLGGTTWMPFQNLAFVTVLMTSYHGLLSWSPVVLLSIIGWCIAVRDPERHVLAVTLLLMFAAEWFANGTLDRYFWGGMSFGARRFVDLAVPFAIGLAWFLERMPRLGASLVCLASAWSIALMAAAQARTVSLSRYVSGSDLVSAVFSADTWKRVFSTPLHSVGGNAQLLVQSAIALVLIAAILFAAPAAFRTRLTAARAATLFLAVCVVIVAICAMRTPRRARESAMRLQIDVERSRHAGPLLDQRGLLSDEVAWAEATGRTARARATRGEIARIDAALQALR